jgi:hypothetical protein
MLLLAVAGGVLGCSEARLPPEIDAFRAALADPAQYPVRKGDDLDSESIVTAMLDFARAHLDVLDAHFRQSLARIPDGAAPAEPGYAKVHEVSPKLLEVAGRGFGAQWALMPDAERLEPLSRNMLLPLMLRDAGFERQRIGAWVAFFATAKPDLRKVEHGEDRITIISDYGKVDVLVLTLSRGELGWSPVGFSWWRPS